MITLGTQQVGKVYLGTQPINKIMLGDIEVFPNVGNAPAWTPADLFTGADLGGYYDFAKTELLFQDAGGRTPVTAIGQPIGLVLSGSPIASTDVPADAWENASTNGFEVFTAVANGFLAEKTVAGGNRYAYSTPAFGISIGAVYKCDIKIVQAAGAFNVLLTAGNNSRSNAVSLPAGAGTYTLYLVANATAASGITLSVQCGTNGTYEVEFSQLELLNNLPLAQVTAAARPVLAADGSSYDGVDDFAASGPFTFGSELTIAVKAKISAGGNTGNTVVASASINSTNFFSAGTRQDQTALRPQGRTSAAGQAAGQGAVGSFPADTMTSAIFWTNSTDIFAENSAGQTATAVYPTPPFLGVTNSRINLCALAQAPILVPMTIQEVVAINRILTPAERLQLFEYWA